MVRKFEHWGTTFVSSQTGGRCRLTGPQRRPDRGTAQGHWPRRGTRRTPSGLGSIEPEPPLPPPPPAALAAASAKPSFRHQRRRLTTCRPRPLLEPGWPPGNEYGQSQAQDARQWRPPWPFSPNADRGSRGRGNGGPSRGQGRRFAGSPSRHSLRYRKPRPPCSLPSAPDRLPGVAAPPSPTRGGANSPSSPPAASACRRPGTRPWIPPLHQARSWASARLAVPENSEHALAPGLRPGTRDAVGGWTGAGESPLQSQPAEASNPCLATFGDKGPQKNSLILLRKPNWD